MGKKEELKNRIMQLQKENNFTDIFVKNIQYIPIIDIELLENVRKDINNESLNNLALSIKEKGLLHPVVVKQRFDGKFSLISGQRRFLACKLLGMQSIMCHVIPEDVKEMDIQLIENLAREDLNIYDKASAIYKFLSDMLKENDHEKIISNLLIIRDKKQDNEFTSTMELDKLENFLKQISLSITSVIRLIYIFGYNKEVQSIIKNYNIPITLVEGLYKYKDEDFIVEVFKDFVSKQMTVSGAISLAKKLKKKNLIEKNKKRKRYFSFIKSIEKKIDEIPQDVSLIKDKDKTIEQLSNVRKKIDILLNKLEGLGEI